MKKRFSILAFLLISPFLLFSQADKRNEQNNGTSIDYVKNADELHHIILPVNEDLTKEIIETIQQFNEQKGFHSRRVSRMVINDVKSGPTNVIVIRKFKNLVLANSYIELMNDNPKLRKLNRVAISYPNYRNYLIKKDFGEYQNFIREGK